MFYSDSTVTPINPPEDSRHGQIIESDSLSDFYLSESKQRRNPKYQRKKKNRSHHASDDGMLLLVLHQIITKYQCIVKVPVVQVPLYSTIYR